SALVGLTLLLGQAEAAPGSPVLSAPVISNPTTTNPAVSPPAPAGAYGKYAPDRGSNSPAPGAIYLPYSSGSTIYSPYTTGSGAAGTSYLPYVRDSLPHGAGSVCPTGAPAEGSVRPWPAPHDAWPAACPDHGFGLFGRAYPGFCRRLCWAYREE